MRMLIGLSSGTPVEGLGEGLKGLKDHRKVFTLILHHGYAFFILLHSVGRELMIFAALYVILSLPSAVLPLTGHIQQWQSQVIVFVI